MNMNKNKFNMKVLISLASGMVAIIFVLWSFFPSTFAPYDPKQMFSPWQKGSPGHILGTNDMGYDILSELIFATSTTLITGVAAALISLIAGTVIGTLAGYYDGWKAELINLFTDVFLLIPMLPMTIILAAFLGPGTGNIILTISLLGWCSTAKAVRAKTRQLRQAGFVESLLILGIPKRRIIFRHIVPNLWDVVLAKYIMSAANCMLMEATISFVGLGDPTRVTWGGMINFAFKRGGFSRGATNWYLTPGICIMLCVLAFYYINIFFENRAKSVSGGDQSYHDCICDDYDKCSQQ